MILILCILFIFLKGTFFLRANKLSFMNTGVQLTVNKIFFLSFEAVFDYYNYFNEYIKSNSTQKDDFILFISPPPPPPLPPPKLCLWEAGGGGGGYTVFTLSVCLSVRDASFFLIS